MICHNVRFALPRSSYGLRDTERHLRSSQCCQVLEAGSWWLCKNHCASLGSSILPVYRAQELAVHKGVWSGGGLAGEALTTLSFSCLVRFSVQVRCLITNHFWPFMFAYKIIHCIRIFRFVAIRQKIAFPRNVCELFIYNIVLWNWFCIFLSFLFYFELDLPHSFILLVQKWYYQEVQRLYFLKEVLMFFSFLIIFFLILHCFLEVYFAILLYLSVNWVFRYFIFIPSCQ